MYLCYLLFYFFFLSYLLFCMFYESFMQASMYFSSQYYELSISDGWNIWHRNWKILRCHLKSILPTFNFRRKYLLSESRFLRKPHNKLPLWGFDKETFLFSIHFLIHCAYLLMICQITIFSWRYHYMYDILIFIILLSSLTIKFVVIFFLNFYIILVMKWPYILVDQFKFRLGCIFSICCPDFTLF